MKSDIERPLRFVLVGCGGISEAWLTPCQEIPDLEIVGLVDLDEARAQARAATYGLEQVLVGNDLTAVLRETEPDIVFDCTVPEAHHDVTLTAFAHDCDVLGEKPLASSMAEAEEMVAAAAQYDKVYAVMQNRRYLAPIRRIRQFLSSGVIGDLTTINCDFYLGPHFGGFRDQMEHVLLLDMAIHTFDQARFMSGSDPAAVYCKEWNPRGSWYAHGASAMAIFEMSNDIVYNYRGSWCAEGGNTSWEAEWRFVGTKGTLKWDGKDEFLAEVGEHTGEFFSEQLQVPVPDLSEDNLVNGHASCIQDYVDCLRRGVLPDTICTDNIKSLSMVFGAIQSARTNKRVIISS